MNHLGTMRIETDRLILRKFTQADADNMFKNWASDKDVTKYLTWPVHSNVDITKSLLRCWEEETALENTYLWCIELKSLKEAIGSLSVVNTKEDVEAVEIGYCIGKNYWNQGIMAEAFSAIIQYLFQDVQVNRIEAKHDVNNPASGKVMKKCGLQLEGIHRQSGKNNMGICDNAVYAILKMDWEQM